MQRRLDDHELQAVASLFGPIKSPVGRTKSGGTLEYDTRRQVIDSGFVMTDEVRARLGDVSFGALDDERPALFETWHCDDTFAERPARATVLHARALPPSGGGPTCFLDMRAAWAGLDADERARLEGVRVHYAWSNAGAFPEREACRGPNEALVDVSHPLVRTHAVTGGKALFIDLDRAVALEGFALEAGRDLLRRLQAHAEASAPTCEHPWRAFDVLVWDNASVQHRARGDFPVGEPRRFWRYMIEGEVPV